MARSDRRGTEKGPENPDKPAGKFGGVPPLAHDPDESPTREDRQARRIPFFEIPVPLPRFLQPRGRRKKRS
jgi:hypothetical protein